ncbi:glycosyltransferase family 2 protein [Polynucleobacter paneuropaeus]|nr:glycosyltransferase family 2 protein [Polynucleobacter paneuropaeus]
MIPQAPELTFSIVSHGQGALIRSLLSDIKLRVGVTYEILITINIPEDEFFLSDFKNFPITIIRNKVPKGFGENHNKAFFKSRGNFFAVVNPDIRLLEDLEVKQLLVQFLDPCIGVISPAVFSSDGVLQDSARKFPTIGSLMLRRCGINKPDYIYGVRPFDVEWVAGMFMVFSRSSFKLVGGFDSRYFMYMEDADICRRLSQLGLKVVVVPSIKVIHDARRASRRNFQHFIWHCKSAALFLLG